MQIVFGSTQAKGVKVSHLHAMSSGSKINWLRRHFHRNFPTQPFALIYMHNIQIGQEVGQKLCKSPLSSGFTMQNNNKGLPSKCLCVQFFFFYWFLKSWDAPLWFTIDRWCVNLGGRIKLGPDLVLSCRKYIYRRAYQFCYNSKSWINLNSKLWENFRFRIDR